MSATRRYGPWLPPSIDQRQALFEESVVYCVDIEQEYAGPTVWLRIDGKQFDWWPSLTWERAEQRAAAL
jgi:hypothetical protein